MCITITESFDLDVQDVFQKLIKEYGPNAVERELLAFLNNEMDFKQAYLLRDMIAKHIKDNE